ncbi:MAG: c-type cytochrome [Saprospiraceae bacterium]|nr:c-type cytochrome [Saprospiraceae bacterium]
MLLAFGIHKNQEVVTLTYPSHWVSPKYDFEANPLTKEKIELGRRLFYDPILSRDNTISCSSCHLSYTAFTHTDHALSHGINDSIGFRNSPVLINLAWNKHFMWDGAIHNIELQALAPIHDDAEMGEDLNNIIRKLEASSTYPDLFAKVFGERKITGEHLLKAMAQFQLSLVSSNSKYDKVMAKQDSFTVQEANGYQIFQQHCNSCHQEPLFTTGDFANNGLTVDSLLMDFGRYRITKQGKDSLMFKIPTLRNIKYSSPYMHDGRFKSLYQTVSHYTDGGIQESPTLAAELRKGIQLSNHEKVDLVAFLLTLSDKDFLSNPDFAYPRYVLQEKKDKIKQ